MGFKEGIIQEFGLKKVQDLEEIIQQQSFFFDTNHSSDHELPIYPVTEKAHLIHDLLSLYGTHWRYIMQQDWSLRREDGDVLAILEGIRTGKNTHRFARYCFTKKYLDEKQSLYLFEPETFGWEYCKKLLNPMFLYDIQDYEQEKQMAGKKKFFN
jgi:hypothetical protein